MQVRQPMLPAEAISGDWARLHAAGPFTVSASETHYLKTLAIALDDDLASLLLLKKLRLAKESAPRSVPRDVVVMNSILKFAFGDEERRCRLVHPSASDAEGCISITSRLGAGLIALKDGQTILWPDDDETLRPLRVMEVDNPGRRSSGDGGAMTD